jgi:hypothetical protein
MQLNFGHHLMLTITLENIKLFYQLLFKNMFFLFSIKLEENMSYGKNQNIASNIQINATNFRNI